MICELHPAYARQRIEFSDLPTRQLVEIACGPTSVQERAIALWCALGGDYRANGSWQPRVKTQMVFDYLCGAGWPHSMVEIARKMGRSRIKNFRSRAMHLPREMSGVLLRLMQAVNDISLAADANDMWAETTEQNRAYRRGAARMYFIRVLMSHLHEALKIVDEINKDTDLRAAADRCDARTQANFATLVTMLNSRERGQLFRFRTKTTFHYDPAVLAGQLEAVITQDPDAIWSCSVGSTPLDWHYELADAVMDRTVVRFVFGADEPRSPERFEKIEKFATRLDEIATMFTDFASNFVERRLRGW